jgi:hypothetical protein
MQISTATVLASQQQAVRAPRSAAQPAEFAPLDFKQTQQQAAEPSAPTGYVRPGTQVDIKV